MTEIIIKTKDKDIKADSIEAQQHIVKYVIDKKLCWELWSNIVGISISILKQ